MISAHDGLVLLAMGAINLVTGVAVLSLRKQPKEDLAPLQRASV